MAPCRLHTAEQTDRSQDRTCTATAVREVVIISLKLSVIHKLIFAFNCFTRKVCHDLVKVITYVAVYESHLLVSRSNILFAHNLCMENITLIPARARH